MLDAIRVILSLLQAAGDDSRVFAATVLRVDGDKALLQAKAGRIHARLATEVKAGERLILKRCGTQDGLTNCRVISREMPESPAARPPLFAALLYAGGETEEPYFFQVREGAAQESDHENKCWYFILQTGSLGTVVLLTEQKYGVFTACLLAEEREALTALQGWFDEFKEAVNSTRAKMALLPGRLMTASEKACLVTPGGNLDLSR